LVAEHGIRALHHNLDTLQPLDFAPAKHPTIGAASASPVRSFLRSPLAAGHTPKPTNHR
jgi:hypothetical protein